MPKKQTKSTRLSLPRAVLTGDRFRVKGTARQRYREELFKAGWSDVDLEGQFHAIALEPYRGNRVRVRTIDRPFYFDQADLAPDWDTDQERLIALERIGWYRNGSGEWKQEKKRP